MDDPRERLVRRVEWSLRKVQFSGGYADTARQVIEDLAELFPDVIEAAEAIAALQAEMDALRFQRDAAVLHLGADLARSRRA